MSVIRGQSPAARALMGADPILRRVVAAALAAPPTHIGDRLERQMIRAHPATAANETDDPPADRTMRIVEVGLAILALAAAGILALYR